MARKLMVNNTDYEINGTIVVRKGSQPGEDDGAVDFKLAKGPGTQEFVNYGSEQNPYVDQLTISAMTNGAVVLSDQIVITRGSELDNMFNMNDTIYIALDGESVKITSGNTWT